MRQLKPHSFADRLSSKRARCSVDDCVLSLQLMQQLLCAVTCLACTTNTCAAMTTAGRCAARAAHLRCIVSGCRVTAQEAQDAYDTAPLSYVDSTNSDYKRIEKAFVVSHSKTAL